MGVLFLDSGCCFYLLFHEGKMDYFVKTEYVPRMMEDPSWTSPHPVCVASHGRTGCPHRGVRLLSGSS